jgi:uncharacterized protein YidB (DUF937 family)
MAMGLLDSVLGAALGNQGGGNANWIGLISSVLANGSAHGGLGGLLQQLEAGGLGQQVQSWISTGANLPVSADQITQALGGAGGAGGVLAHLAEQAGVSHAEAGQQLSQLLPEIINHLTPNGQVPSGGAGGAADIIGMLGGLLSR